jgi:hypothetical protein
MCCARLGGFADQDGVRSRRGAGADAEESIEGGVLRSASIETEDELVQVVLKVDPARAVVDAQTPSV